ncbi:hypothetical protein ACFU99_04500 [Streptomyces sp. NPDC057654]|uniref:hypothetical protein n=1 Tax=Streptomyces sp. NPDC057654 TaxID=3346196 RepID=UPI0036A8BC77
MTDPLIVPVEVSALFVNDRVRSEDTFFRWKLSFDDLTARTDPELSPDQTTGVQHDAKFNGVHLHWQLPAALACGQVGAAPPGGRPDAAGVTFPLVPNRWLVIRHCRDAQGKPLSQAKGAAGWIVHSDFLDDQDGTSPFLHPQTKESTYIGRAVDLNGAAAWKEPGGEPFLTVIGPGIGSYAAFQPYNENVFSFHDRLTGLSDEIQATGRLSYLVAGWHSTAQADPLADARLTGLLRFRGHDTEGLSVKRRFAEGLTALGWMPETGLGAVPGRSLYAGTVLDLKLERGRPASDIPQVMNLTVDTAVGHSMTDARTALDISTGPDKRLFHEAFEYDALDQLDDAIPAQKDPKGLASRDILAACSHASGFTPWPAGFAWTVVDRPTVGTTGPGGGPTSNEEAILAALTARQDTYDTALRDLVNAQERLYTLWWLQGLPDYGDNPPDGFQKMPDDFRARAKTQLDPAARNSLTHQVSDLSIRCFERTDPKGKKDGGLRATVPQGDAPGLLQQSIDAYAKQAGLAPHRTLRRVPRPPFHLPADPTVVLSGQGTRTSLPGSNSQPARAAERLIATASDTRLTPPSEIPVPAQFPSVRTDIPWAPLDKLLTEFWILAEAARLARDTPPGKDQTFDGILKQLKITLKDTTGAQAGLPPHTGLWRQHWAPLMLWWTSEVHPLPYRTGSTADGLHWDFDGRDHRWKGTGQLAKGMAGGRIALTALPPFALAGRVDQYLNRHGTQREDELRALVTAARDQIAQQLTGLNAWLAQRMPAVCYDPPDKSFAGLLVRSPFTARPSTDLKDSNRVFDPVRAAQFAFGHLVLVDRFGRGVDMVRNKAQYRPRLPASTQPDTDKTGHPLTVEGEDRGRFVQLRPRLNQPARACLDLVSATDDHRALQTGDAPHHHDPANPVCGWLVYDPHEHSLLVHAPDGTGLGEILVTGPDQPAIAWVPLPGSAILTLDDVFAAPFTTRYPHLASFLQGLLHRADAPAALSELTGSINTALTGTVRPPHQFTAYQSFLSGSPLALLRARARIELAAPPLYAATWDRILAGPDPKDGNPLHATRWPVRLGDRLRRSDGLIGFCRAATPGDGTTTDYTRMLVTHPPSGSSPAYAHDIEKGDADPTVIAAQAPRPGTPPPTPPTDAWVTLLVAPWAPVHAYTGILPMTTAQLPEPYLTGPLSRMPVGLRTGPLLAGLRTPGPHQREGVALPVPTTKTGTWAWWERTPHGAPAPWASYPLAGTGEALRPPAAPPPARTGYLTLTPGAPDTAPKTALTTPDGDRP